ncbi:MAG: flippase [Candidatus Melainabacteria bacterium]|nr:flippase [Candidatus Melainabacteria bacterium]
MNKKEPLSRKLTFGIFYLLSSSLATVGINIITVGFIARKLGVENFGLYSTILSFVQLFQFLSDFGLNKTLLKFGSTDFKKTQISFGNALFVKSILIIPTLILVTFLGFLAGYRNEGIIILELFAIGLILESYSTVFSSIRRILGNFKLISFFRILKTVINLIIIVIALSMKNSVLSLAFANMLLCLVVFVISLLNTVLLLKPKLRLNLIPDFFKDSIIFSLNDFFLNIYGRISTVLLSFFNDLHSVGIYSAAVRSTRIANLLPNQVKFALLPTMYRILEDRDLQASSPYDLKPSIHKEKRVFGILLKYMVIFATPSTIAIYFFSDSIINLIFSNKYNLAIPLVKLFSLFIYLRFIETPFSLFYIAMNKHKNMVYFQGFTSILNVILNLILIPFYSASGACVATLISEVVFALMLIFAGSKYLVWHFKDVFTILLKPTLSGFISLIPITIFLHKTNIFIQMFFLFLCYLLILFVIKSFNKEDKELFKKIFRKNNVIVSD